MATPLIAVEQTTSAGFSEGAITVDYPSGIAVDDLMVLVLFCSELDAISTPSGWTDVSVSSTTFQGDVDTDVYMYKKVVVSGDVTAGSISVDVDDTAGELAYTCLRLSGYNTTTETEALSSGDDTSSGTGRSHAVSIAPTTAGSLLIIAAGADGNGVNGTYTATGSPTFTEVSDIARSTTDRVSVAYAELPGTSTITNLGFTAATSIDRSQMVGFVVRTAVDETGTAATEEPTINLFTQNGNVGSAGSTALFTATNTFSAPTAIGETPVWSNEVRPTLSQTELNAVFMDGDNMVWMDGDNAIYRAAEERDWTNETRP